MSEAQIIAWLTSQPSDRVQWCIYRTSTRYQIDLTVVVGGRGDDDGEEIRVSAIGKTLIEAWEKLQGKAATFHAALRKEGAE